MLQIPDLNALFAANPGAFSQGQRMMGLNEMFALDTKRRQQEELDLRRQSEERINRNTEGQLELQRRGADQREREWNEQAPTRELNRKKIESDLELDAAERPVRMAEIASRAERRKTQDQLDRVRSLATGMNQAAEIAETMGPGAAKAHLTKLGFEGWDPRWEDPKILSQEGLGQVLRNLGGRLTKASADFQQRQILQDDKQDAAARLQAQRDAAALARVQQQGALRAQIEEIKKKAIGGRDPRTLEELATSLRIKAQNAEDPEMRNWYANEAAVALAAAQSLKAQTPEKTVINPNIAPEVLRPTDTTRPNPLQGTVPVPRPGTTPVPAQPAAASPAPPGRPTRQDIPKQPAGVPQGRVAVYKGKDVVGHIPESQIEDAMKQGYSLRPL